MRHAWTLLVLLAACGGATIADLPPDAGASADQAGDGSTATDAAADARDSGSSADSAAIDSGGADAGSDASHARDASTPCGPTVCNGGEICVVTTSGGGPCLLPNDAGQCPNGKPPSGYCCDDSVTTYECQPLPSSCGGALACPCATSLCKCGGCALGPAPDTLDCVCAYP